QIGQRLLPLAERVGGQSEGLAHPRNPGGLTTRVGGMGIGPFGVFVHQHACGDEVFAEHLRQGLRQGVHVPLDLGVQLPVGGFLRQFGPGLDGPSFLSGTSVAFPAVITSPVTSSTLAASPLEVSAIITSTSSTPAVITPVAASITATVAASTVVTTSTVTLGPSMAGPGLRPPITASPVIRSAGAVTVMLIAPGTLVVSRSAVLSHRTRPSTIKSAATRPVAARHSTCSTSLRHRAALHHPSAQCTEHAGPYEGEGMSKRDFTCSQTHTKEKRRKHTKHLPLFPSKKTVAATYSPTPPQGSTISVRRLHDRVRKETGYNPSTKTTTETNREQRARTPSYLQRTSPRPISTGQLHPLQGFHTRPSNPIIHREP